MFWGQIAQAKNRWAVIIGIEEYQDSRLNLEYTEDDATAMYQVLSTKENIPEQNIHFLLNEKATKAAISKAFRDWLPEHVKPGDFVVVYYSGHGIQGPDRNPKDEQDNEDEYLVPYDFDISSLETTAETGVRDDLIAEWLGKLPSDTVVIFDSCYSGGGIKMISKGTPRNPYALLPRLKMVKSTSPNVSPPEGMQKEFSGLSEHITFLASCQPYQSAQEYLGLKHGIFTYYLIKGLQGAADQNNDGQIFVSEAFRYTEQQMSSDARTEVSKQQPLIWTKRDNVFVFVTPSDRTPAGEATPTSIPKSAPDSEKIQVDLWFDILEADGTVTPGIENKEYQSGAIIRLSFKVTQNCYLFVFNIDQDGEAYNFHPVDPEADESVPAEKDRVYSVQAKLDEVLGEERFYAIASERPFSLSQDVLSAVDKEFQARGLKIDGMKELNLPFPYATISFKHR